MVLTLMLCHLSSFSSQTLSSKHLIKALTLCITLLSRCFKETQFAIVFCQVGNGLSGSVMSQIIILQLRHTVWDSCSFAVGVVNSCPIPSLHQLHHLAKVPINGEKQPSASAKIFCPPVSSFISTSITTRLRQLSLHFPFSLSTLQ